MGCQQGCLAHFPSAIGHLNAVADVCVSTVHERETNDFAHPNAWGRRRHMANWLAIRLALCQRTSA